MHLPHPSHTHPHVSILPRHTLPGTLPTHTPTTHPCCAMHTPNPAPARPARAHLHACICALPVFFFPGYNVLVFFNRRLPGASVLPSLSPRPVPRSRPVSGWGSTPREARDRDGGGAVSSGAVGIGGCGGRAAVGAGAQSSAVAAPPPVGDSGGRGCTRRRLQAHCTSKPRRARWRARAAPAAGGGSRRWQQAIGLAAHGAKEAAAEVVCV